MSLAISKTRSAIGINALPVYVEVHLSNGLPGFAIVGLPETAVKESKDRVRSAIINSQFEFPCRKITVSLAPADLPKSGSGFDLPVLHYRALLHGVPAPTYWETGDNQQAFRWNNYLNRFHYRHLDLMDVLAAYQNKAFAPLDDIASMLGFPGKMGMSGAHVWEQYLAGNLKGIRDYCETDVLNTYCVYLRFEQMRGTISEIEYKQSLERLRNYLAEETSKPHLRDFLKQIK